MEQEVLLAIQLLADNNDVPDFNVVQNIVRNLGLAERIDNEMRPENVEHIRNRNYYELTIPQYNPDEFHSHFRMKRETMQLLTNIIGNQMRPHQTFIPVEKKVLLTVWILAKPESFLAAGDRFGLSASSAHYCFMEILTVIANLIPTYINWPDNAECLRISNEFEIRSGGIPGVVGVIDGCHIPIKQPVNNAIDYYNRKGFHSIILQAVCSDNRKFTDICIGSPGRMHDARVFRNSPLFENLQNNLLPVHMHLIGDAAYPLLQHLITPFRNTGHLNRAQIRYNGKLSSIRSTIERSFALLKGKFRRLKYLDISNMQLLNKTVGAACVLHNFIIDNEGTEEFEVADLEDFMNNDHNNIPNDVEGIEKRRWIMDLL